MRLLLISNWLILIANILHRSLYFLSQSPEKSRVEEVYTTSIIGLYWACRSYCDTIHLKTISIMEFTYCYVQRTGDHWWTSGGRLDGTKASPQNLKVLDPLAIKINYNVPKYTIKNSYNYCKMHFQYLLKG